MQLQLTFTAFNLTAKLHVTKEKPCLNCGGKVLNWSIYKRICSACKKDGEWKAAAKGLSDIYSVDLRTNRKGKE